VQRISPRSAFMVAIAIILSAAGLGVLNAQQTEPSAKPSIKRTVLLKKDMTIPEREAVMVLVDLPPGATEGRHTHPAEVYVYVLEGTPTIDIEGQESRTLKPGDVFSIAPGQIHEGSNKSAAPAKLSAVFFAEKGKPLTTPVP
jgi:quercetin dioxygenase-like cupin family protein